MSDLTHRSCYIFTSLFHVVFIIIDVLQCLCFCKQIAFCWFAKLNFRFTTINVVSELKCYKMRKYEIYVGLCQI